MLELRHNFDSEQAEARGDISPTLPIMAVLMLDGAVEDVYEARSPEHAAELFAERYATLRDLPIVDKRQPIF